MSDTDERELASSAFPELSPCPECGSRQVRPAQRSYPKDRERIGASVASFWRCDLCGSRFLGAYVPEMSPKDSSSGRRRGRDSLDREIRRERRWRGKVFPILVLLLTILAVGYVLSTRDRPAATFIR